MEKRVKRLITLKVICCKLLFLLLKKRAIDSSIPDYYENCSEKKQEQMSCTACLCKFRACDCLDFRKKAQYSWTMKLCTYQVFVYLFCYLKNEKNTHKNVEYKTKPIIHESV